MKQFSNARMEAIHTGNLTENQIQYRQGGYLIKRDLVPSDVIERYLALRDRLGLGLNEFPDVTAFVEHEEVRDLLCHEEIIKMLRELHSCDMGLIFALTKYQSTQRGWHPDSYLDRDDAIPRAAVWIALGDVEVNHGPFEYIHGSHLWPILSNQKINNYLNEPYQWPDAHRSKQKGVPGWGRIAEAFVSPAIERKLAEEGRPPEQFIAKRGDVLIWYARLIHRGSKPATPETPRAGLIGHYAPVFEKERGLFAKSRSGGYFIVPPAKVDKLV